MTALATQAGRHFLDDVLADPADDGIRLIYADWLEDHGDAARAEFIRVQIEAERRGGRCLKIPLAIRNAVPLSMCCVVCDLWLREQELLDAASLPGRFNAVFPSWVEIWVWHRGFVEEIALQLAAFLGHAAELFRDHPVTVVRLTDKMPRAVDNGRAWWYYRQDGSVLDVDDLPATIFDKLVGDAQDGATRVKYYDSQAAAYSALSAACVAYGRDLAKLPPLPPAISQTPSP